jgi:hypothetical protein
MPDLLDPIARNLANGIVRRARQTIEESSAELYTRSWSFGARSLAVAVYSVEAGFLGAIDLHPDTGAPSISSQWDRADRPIGERLLRLLREAMPS